MRALALLLLLPLAALPACKTTMTLPPDFLALDGGRGYRAVTATDARVWVREFRDHDEGTLDFWLASLREDLERNRGYAIVDQGECQDADGRPGRWLECRQTLDGERHGYLVAVFVRVTGLLDRRHWVVTCEFGAREEVFLQHLPAVKAALPTIDP